MLRKILQQFAIRREFVSHSFSSVSVRHKSFDVKINLENDAFELHEEVDASGKQKKFEFPFVYLRDNCQVGLPHRQPSRRQLNEFPN